MYLIIKIILSYNRVMQKLQIVNRLKYFQLDSIIISITRTYIYLRTEQFRNTYCFGGIQFKF